MATFRFDAAKLRAAREQAGVSEERLALILHPSPYSVQAYETGLAQPSRAALIRIAAAVGVEPVDLLVRDEVQVGSHDA